MGRFTREVEGACDRLREAFAGTYIANGGYTPASAEERVHADNADAVAFGSLYIANPDLAERIVSDAPLNDPDSATFYGGTEQGYTDYPALAESGAQTTP